jgi:hypothetical protein
MKKIFGTIVVFLLTMNMMTAQDNYLDMRLGAGIPRSSFSELEGDSVGYAGTGFMMSFEGNYFFLGTLGVVGSITYGMNFLDEVALQDHLKARFQESFPDVTIPDDATTQWLSKQWNNVNLMAGPVLSFPFSSLKLELRGMAGVSFVMPPEWDLYMAWEDKQFHVTSSGQSARFAWQLGAGLLYKSELGYGFRLGFDYFKTSTRFDVYYSYVQGNVDEVPYESIDQYIPVTMFQATLGILYAF